MTTDKQTPPLPDFLEKLRIQNAGPFQDFTIEFRSPVTVIAGPNGTGKTTILLAASSAHNPQHRVQPHLYDTLLPPRPLDWQLPECVDQPTEPDSNKRPVSLQFTYAIDSISSALTVDLTHKWEHTQPKDPTSRPKRPTYLKTMATLSSIPQLRPEPNSAAHAARIMNRVLDQNYKQVIARPAQHGHKHLSALRSNHTWHRQSEMSYGEHAVARLAYDLTRLEGGLALIDMIETGLHPDTSRKLTKEIIRLSETTKTQFIITTHSPEVTGATPPEGIIFLEPDHQGNILATTHQ